MATPRKHYFRVADSILRETWDDATLATLVRLMAFLNQRWARDGLTAEQACTVRLRMVDLLPLVNRSRPAAALTVLRSCSDAVAMTVTVESGACTISWPKFAEFQGYAAPKPAPKHAPSASASASAPAEELREECEPASPGSAPPPKRQARAVPEVPTEAHAFAQDFRDALVKVHDGFKPPSANAFERWRQEARLLLAADKRPPDEARDLASWLFADPGDEAVFWRGNVLSVQKFRQKYDQLRAQKQRAEERKRGAAHRGSTLLALAYT